MISSNWAETVKSQTAWDRFHWTDISSNWRCCECKPWLGGHPKVAQNLGVCVLIKLFLNLNSGTPRTYHSIVRGSFPTPNRRDKNMWLADAGVKPRTIEWRPSGLTIMPPPLVQEELEVYLSQSDWMIKRPKINWISSNKFYWFYWFEFLFFQQMLHFDWNFIGFAKSGFILKMHNKNVDI